MPAKYMSIITDGMDSSKTNIPHFKMKSRVSLFNSDNDTQMKLRKDIRTACKVLEKSRVNFMNITDVLFLMT